MSPLAHGELGLQVLGVERFSSVLRLVSGLMSRKRRNRKFFEKVFMRIVSGATRTEVARMNTTLAITNGSAEIQEVSGVKYLVARLEDAEKGACSHFVSELEAGRPVVVPFSKRAWLTTLLKKERVFTRSKTVVPGQWVTFIPCEEREFKS